MNLGSHWNVIYNKLRNYRYDHWLITDDSVTHAYFLNFLLDLLKIGMIIGNHSNLISSVISSKHVAVT